MAGKNIIKFIKGLHFVNRVIKYYLLNIQIYFASVLRNKKITNISVKNFNSNNYFHIDLIGEIKTYSDEIAEKHINKIKDDAVLVGYTEHDIQVENFINLYKYKDIILSSRNGKIGVSVFKDIDEINIKNVLLRKQILDYNGAGLKVAYVKASTDTTVNLLNLIGKNGYDVVVCTNDNIRSKKYFRNNAFKEARVFYSIGKIISVEADNDMKKNTDLFISLTLKYDFIHNKIAQEYYRPFFVNSNNIENISIKDGANSEKYNTIHSLLQPLHCKERMFTLGEISEALKLKLPPRYAYMENYTVNGICSRTGEIAPGSIFFFRQQFTDKNDLKKYNEFIRLRLYIRATLRKARFVFSYRNLPNLIPWMKVENAMEAHIKCIRFFRDRFVNDVKVIAVTGSIGKTSTKDMIFSVFKNAYSTEKSLRNSNVQVKIGLNIQNIKRGTKFFVQEIGGGRPGGASRHSRMVTPDAAIVTNVGTAHIGNFESQIGLAFNKLAITEGMTENGILYLNGDDPLLFDSNMISSVKQRIIYYGIKNKECDYYADDIHTYIDRIDFTIVSKRSNKWVKCKVNVPGIHNVINAVCAFAIAEHYGIDEETIVTGIEAFRTAETRQNLITVGENRLFVDCYNASLDSVKSSLNTLLKIGGMKDKKIAILGDITGMGEHQSYVNNELAKIICSCSGIDEIICYGAYSKEIVKNILNLEKDINCKAITNRELLEIIIEDRMNKDTIILFKGSSRMKLDEIIDSVYGLALADQRYVDEGKRVKYYKDGIEYNLFEEYASVNSMKSAKGVVRIPNTIIGKPIKIICASACEGNEQIEDITLGQNIKHIGESAFKNCICLKNIKFSSNLKFIGASAFEGCDLISIDMRDSTPIVESCNNLIENKSKVEINRKEI